MTPTSGASPYFLSAIINTSESIDSVNYVASIRYSVGTGSCPTAGTGLALAKQVVDEIIAGNNVQLAISTVPAGTCRTFTLVITRVNDGKVVDSANAYIDNV